MNDSPIPSRIARLFRGASGKRGSGFGEGLLLESLELRVLYSGSPVEAPPQEVSGAPELEAVQVAAPCKSLSSFEVASLPVAEMATLRAGVVTVSHAAEGDPELLAALAHETSHSVESRIESSPLLLFFGPGGP